jgi:hypothetical protein
MLLVLAAGPGCGGSSSRDVVAPAAVPNDMWFPGLGDCDADDDGYAARPCAGSNEADCDDHDPTAHPGAKEEPDGVDDDCDGQIDEGTGAWDADGDCVCGTPPCTGSANAGCLELAGGDCDDADPHDFPGNAEVCDGADNDCDQVPDDGLTFLSWWPDVDEDGFGSAVAAPARTCGDPPAGAVANNADCDDLHASVGPRQDEIECDQLDNDCDPSTRDGEDDDRDGVDHCFDCDDDDRDRSPAHEEVCDGVDNDCDGEVDDGLDFDDYWRDNDGDGFGDDNDDEIELCEDAPGWVENDDDCNDGNYWVNPDAFEWHCDGVDNDCSGGDRCP